MFTGPRADGGRDGSLRRVKVHPRQGPRSFTVSGTAIPQGVAVDRLLERLDGVSAEASSRVVRPARGVPATPRRRRSQDLLGRRSCRACSDSRAELAQSTAGGGSAHRDGPGRGGRWPTEVEVTVDGQTYQRAVQRDGSIDLPVVTVDNVALRVTATTTLTPDRGRAQSHAHRHRRRLVDRGVLAGRSLPDHEGRHPMWIRSEPHHPGQGLRHDGQSRPEGDLVAGRPATLRTCGEVQVNLRRVAVQALSSGEFSVRPLLLQPTMAAPLDLGSTIEGNTMGMRPAAWLHLGVARARRHRVRGP